MDDQQIAEELILEAARDVQHSRIRTRIAGLAAAPSDDQWRQIHAVEELVATATLSVEFGGRERAQDDVPRDEWGCRIWSWRNER